ncbi:MAG: hypothetical protein IPK14_17125 [Blastocatellia bacterium]|nr:hypothetical protein [Blastocatellia bacterium]
MCKVGGEIDDRLKNWITLHANGQIPDGVAYELRDLVLSLGDTANLKDLIKVEAKRIFRRKKVDKDVLTNIEKRIDEDKVSIKDLADELVVARIFAEVKKLIGKEK